ncbi:queuosine precursor transporter [Planctomycetota bacterium]|nr:queuosine precursor transporter [Planctomycetota bacterium]
MTGFEHLPHIDEAKLKERRERVFILMAGLFLGTLTMLNILGITRFIKLYEIGFGEGDATWSLVFAVAVGVLPYPMTFLCTDLISEFYGKRRANYVVLIGLLLNAWVVFILWVGGILPGWEAIDAETGRLVADAAGRKPLFFELQALAFGAVGASMIAYLAAQLCDVWLFHFWKKLTKGKHLWLRNNGSTLVSQMVDTTAVILITYYFTTPSLPIPDGTSVWFQLLVGYIAAGYIFKMFAALVDTPIIYAAVYYLKDYLRIDPTKMHEFGDVED